MNNLFTAFHLSSLFEHFVKFCNVFITQNYSQLTRACRPCVDSSLKIFKLICHLVTLTRCCTCSCAGWALFNLPASPIVPTAGAQVQSQPYKLRMNLMHHSPLPFQGLERTQQCLTLTVLSAVSSLDTRIQARWWELSHYFTDRNFRKPLQLL